MKKLLLSCVAVLSFSYAFAQPTGTCLPDSLFADSLAGPYPRPYEATTNPTGGINLSACIGKDYEFIFTVVVSDSITVDLGGGPSTFPLDSVIISDVEGLPVGITYACNFTGKECTFVRNTLNCAVLYGAAVSSNEPKVYPLTIKGVVYINGFLFPLPLSFPGPGFPGEYNLVLEPETSTTCFVWSNTSDRLQDKIAFSARPNPANNLVQIEVNSGIVGKFDLRLLNLVGAEMERQSVEIQEGTSTFSLDASQFPNGMYLLTLENETGSLAQKLIIQH